MDKLLLSQVFGFIGVAFIISSYQFKKKTTMMKFILIANVLYIVQYALLNAYSATLTCGIAILRIILFNKYDKEGKPIPLPLIAFIVGLCVITGIFTYDGLLSLIPILITITYAIAATAKDPKTYKITCFFCALVWIYFNFTVGAYPTLIGNGFEVVSTVIGAKRKYK